MKKQHAGSGKPQGVLNRGTHTRPSLTHGGTNLSKGVVNGPPRPQIYGTHGGTNLPRRLNKRK
jgi:hypothetical protein